jgi:hypothetical protein
VKAVHSVILGLVLAGMASAAEAPSFVKKPTATRDGDRTTVDFTVDRNTDVAVTVEDAKGKVVRHLVAGVLGKNPPEPLKPNSLAQSLVWDGKDDSGKAVAGKGFTVRVRLGLKPQFGDFLLHNPDASGEVSAVAVGPEGALYLFHKDGTANGNMGGHKVKVYTRDGKHKKVLVPFPADLDAKKLKGVGVFRDGDDLVPHLHNFETLSFYTDNVGVRGRDMPEYTCPAVDSKGRVYWLVKGRAWSPWTPTAASLTTPSSARNCSRTSRIFDSPVKPGNTIRSGRVWRSAETTSMSTSPASQRARATGRRPSRCPASSALTSPNAPGRRCSLATSTRRAMGRAC